MITNDDDTIHITVIILVATDIVCLFVCLVFNGTFSTNRLYRATAAEKYIM